MPHIHFSPRNWSTFCRVKYPFYTPLYPHFNPFLTLHSMTEKYIYSYIRSGRIYAQLSRLENCQKYWYP